MEWDMFDADSLVWATNPESGARTPRTVPKVYIFNKRTGRVYEFLNTCEGRENGCFGDVPMADQRAGYWTTPEPFKHSGGQPD
ncbi:MAG: hypothetical protein OXC19_17445 [Bryobacterales bacterium]|nr:hypothetical protein [Bryobacterales bacterium]